MALDVFDDGTGSGPRLFLGFSFMPTPFTAIHVQWAIDDSGAVAGIALSNCVVGTTP